MQPKKFVTSTQEKTHTPYLLGCVTDDGQISSLLQPVKSQDLGKKAQSVSNRCKDLLERKNILGLGAL